MPEPTPVRAVEAEPGERDGGPTWACPACEHTNAISFDRCEVCDTAFAQLFAEPERSIEISPSRAFGWSLVLPGLGHWMAGRKLDGIARMVLFGWTFGTVVTLLISRRGGGFGSTGALLAVFAVSAIAIYAVSAVDARRVAEDEAPVISSRTLLWASVVLVVVSVLLATLLALPAARGG